MGVRLGTLLGLALIVGCSQAPEPAQPAEARDEAKAPDAAVAAPAPVEPPSVAPAPSSPEEQPVEAAPPPDPSVIVIDPGGEGSEEVDLVATARAERERRAAAPRTNRRITNQNLVKAKPGEKPAEKPAAPAVAASPGSPDARDEVYWRGRSRELRQRWKEAVDEVSALERDADLLRRRFYEEADPYVRDGRIKPDWDRVLDRIREMREESERRREELTTHLEEGRRAGALPGWLREGSELEPPAAAVPVGERPHESIEPPIYPDPRETTDDEDGDG